ncbi:MAG: hypothetical protein HON70_22135, partial [Lentisphaerae bacterium]|nr:hypothetical protein [Lentisphaerota bacterium]
KLRALMGRYNDGDKPIWITEVGWPTHSSPADVGGFMNGIVKAGMKAIVPSRTTWSAALLQDHGYAHTFSPEAEESAREMLQATTLRTVTLKELPTLSPNTTQILLMPPNEGFPVGAFDAIESYVRNGGVVMLWSGVPLYYAMKQKPDGTWDRPHASESFRRRLRIGWEAWWTKDGVPKKVKKTAAAEEWKGLITFPKRTPEATRFLTDSALKPGDTFVPLAVSSDKDYTGVSAAAYALNSDMEGGVIVTTFSSFGRNVTQDRQGQICPRAYLIALQAGIQRMFWYEFQAVEHDPFYNEHHFGMVHRDLSPKPAYTAVKALTRARPAGSQNAKHNWRSEDGAFYFPHWRRPDGKMAWALWKAERSQSCSLAITGSVTEAFDHLGAPVTVSVRNGEVQIDVTESILYLVGPENVAVTVIDTP